MSIAFYGAFSIVSGLKSNKEVSQVNQNLIKEFLRRQAVNRDLIKENNEILVKECFK